MFKKIHKVFKNKVQRCSTLLKNRFKFYSMLPTLSHIGIARQEVFLGIGYFGLFYDDVLLFHLRKKYLGARNVPCHLP